MRVVLDTNVIASAIFFGGKPRQIIEMLMTNDINAYVTVDIAEEYKDTVVYLIEKYPKKASNIPLNEIIARCSLIESTSNINVCRDPDDNKFLECAVDAKCLFIVSGDNDLLSLSSYEGVEIITVTDFLERFGDK